MVEWSLQDAKNKFSALVNAALTGEPQRVTRRGQSAVVVLAAEEYDRLCLLEKAASPTLGELLAQIPQDDGEFERLSVSARPLCAGENGIRELCVGWRTSGRRTCT